MFKTIEPGNVITRPIRVYKEWNLTQSDIIPTFGNEPTSSTYYTNTVDNKLSLYRSIKTQYYTNGDTASAMFDYGLRNNYTSTDERNIGDTIAVLSIPQSYYGEGVKVGSVKLVDGSHTYTDDFHSNLVSGSGDIVGNIIYGSGNIILTQNVVSGSTLSNFNLTYKSTKTIYETEILLNVTENEFNISQNPTAIDYDENGENPTVKWNSISSSYNTAVSGGFGDYEYMAEFDQTGSYLAPYITTIGLYDNNYDMVAVAKLPQPIKCFPDYPMNFIIRFDI